MESSGAENMAKFSPCCFPSPQAFREEPANTGGREAAQEFVSEGCWWHTCSDQTGSLSQYSTCTFCSVHLNALLNPTTMINLATCVEDKAELIFSATSNDPFIDSTVSNSNVTFLN